MDSKGNLYIADECNNRVRKVDPTGIITTVAGSGNSMGVCYMATGYSGDGGPATAAQLNRPTSVAVDSTGNIYITDVGNEVIRKVNTNGIISTFAGGGTAYPGNGGPATSASLPSLLGGLAVDTAGNLYIADGSSMIRKVTPDGTITTVAGGTSSGYTGDGGSATQATLSNPGGVAVDASGNLYIADTANCVIRKVSGGVITTFAGTNASCGLYFGSSGDGGPATSAQLNLPWGVAVDSGGNIYIGVPGAHNVREVLAASGTIQTVVAAGENYLYKGTQSISPIREPSPYNVAVSGTSVYVPDQFYQVVWVFNGSGSINGGAPTITSGGIVPNDSSATTIQAGEWVSIYGVNLAGAPVTWTGNFPTSLGGTSVTIDGRKAYLRYVSPTQINLQAPDDSATGSVTVVVTTPNGTASSTVTLAEFAPSFNLLDTKHVAGVILRSDGSGAYGGGSYDIIGPTGTALGYATVAAQAGDSVELFGVGFGPTSPPVDAGALFSGSASTTNAVSLRINDVNIIPSFAGLSAAGLYQINFTVPASLGTGDVALVATVGGASTQPGVVISLE